MQPIVAHLTSKMGGATDTFFVKIKAQKQARHNMDITTANRLYELRKQHGFSQDELADKLNVSRQAVSKWERSESSPDTDNLIALAKLYGISLDELLNYTPQKSDDNGTQNADAQAQDGTVEGNEHFDNQDGGRFTYEENGERVHIDDNGAFTYSGDGEHVHIDENGIHVHDKDGSNVVIKGGIAKLVNKIVGDIHVDNNKNGANGDDSNDEKAKNPDFVHIENGHITFTNKRAKNLAVLSSAISGATFLLCTVAYILIGCLCNLWHPGWLLFFVPMIIGGIFDCIAKKNPSAFPIIIIVVAVYLLLGCGWGMWHPYWAIFAVIPAYYAVAEPIKHAVKQKNRGIEINISTPHSDDCEDDCEDD